MFSGTNGISQSSSCSTVNGQTICEDQQSSGNTAIASSMAMSGPNFSQQGVYAGAGNPGGQWSSGRQTATGGSPSGGSTNYNYDPGTASGGFGVLPDYGDDDDDCTDDDASYSANMVAFAAPVSAVSGFGFASAGSFPISFFPGVANPQGGVPPRQRQQQGYPQGQQQGYPQGQQQRYPQGQQQRYPQGQQQGYPQGQQQVNRQGQQQGYSQRQQQGYPQGQQQGYPQGQQQQEQQQQQQQGFNPFQFVNQFMNGGGGAFAGPGVAYTGQNVAYAGPGVAYAGGGAFPMPFPFGGR